MKQRSREIKRKWYETQFFKEHCLGKKPPKEFVAHEVLALLPSHYRNVLEAKYLENLTVKKIADTYGYSEKAMESLLIRAKEKFRQTYLKLERREFNI